METKMSTFTSQVEVPAGVTLPIYMDNHATSPLDPRVLAAMMPYFTSKFGNAASRNHSFGWEAEKAVEAAREQIARLIGASAKEIIFTSGATESNNLAIKGIAEMYRERGNHIITQVTEHKAVLDTCKRLEKYGYRVTYLPVKADGLIDLDDLRRAMDDKTILVSIMAANNEIGVLQPIAEIGKLCHERGVLFHTDAVQAVGKVPVNVYSTCSMPQQPAVIPADHVELPFQAAYLSQRLYAGLIDCGIVAAAAGVFGAISYKMLPKFPLAKPVLIAAVGVLILLWAVYQYLFTHVRGRYARTVDVGHSLAHLQGWTPELAPSSQPGHRTGTSRRRPC